MKAVLFSILGVLVWLAVIYAFTGPQRGVQAIRKADTTVMSSSERARFHLPMISGTLVVVRLKNGQERFAEMNDDGLIDKNKVHYASMDTTDLADFGSTEKDFPFPVVFYDNWPGEPPIIIVQ